MWSNQSSGFYFEVLLPKGYRILRYVFDIDGASSTSGVGIKRLAYDDNFEAVEGSGVTVDKTSSNQVWAENLATNVNALYFKVTTGSKSDVLYVFHTDNLCH